MIYGEHDAYNNELYMLYSELHCQIDKNRKIEVAGTPLYNARTGSLQKAYSSYTRSYSVCRKT
jgi:hypothetical protein